MNIKKSFQLLGNSIPKLVVAALPVWLGLTPVQALAVDAVGGNSTNGDVNMPQNVWTTLRSVLVVNPANTTRYCMVVGSADVRRPDANGIYLFTLTDNDPNPLTNDGDERTVEFFGADNRVKEVTTTQAFVTGPGNHLIRWLGAPTTVPASPATVALDSSLSMVCTDKPLGPIVDSHPEATPPL